MSAVETFERPADIAPGPQWHTWDRPLHVPMVEIPRDLALDLVRFLSVDDFIYSASEEDLKKERQYQRHEAHKSRLEALVELVGTEMLDADIKPTAEVMLRTLSILYEGAALVGKGGAL